MSMTVYYALELWFAVHVVGDLGYIGDTFLRIVELKGCHPSGFPRICPSFGTWRRSGSLPNILCPLIATLIVTGVTQLIDYDDR